MSNYLRETCPACQAVNWLDNDHDMFDTDAYTCHACKADVRLMVGEYADEYRPHVEGDDPWDENACGRHVDGEAVPR